METLKEKQKNEALKRMAMLNLMPQVIKDFEKNNKVYYSERQNAFFNAILYWLDNEPNYVEIVDKFEKEHNCLVYHCQLTHMEFGDLLSLLYVSENEEEWEQDKKDLREGYAFSYIVNIGCECYNDFGTIGIRPSQGGVLRTA